MPKNEAAACTDEEREESPALSLGEKLPLDDPSEYRPELKNIGKTKEQFRGFCEVWKDLTMIWRILSGAICIQHDLHNVYYTQTNNCKLQYLWYLLTTRY